MDKVIVHGIEFYWVEDRYVCTVSENPYIGIAVTPLVDGKWLCSSNAVNWSERAENVTAQEAAEFAFNAAHKAANDLCDAFLKVVQK